MIQTGTIRDFPVILLGAGRWDGMLTWLRDSVLRDRRIGEHDLGLLQVTSDPPRVVELVAAAREDQRTLMLRRFGRGGGRAPT